AKYGRCATHTTAATSNAMTASSASEIAVRLMRRASCNMTWVFLNEPDGALCTRPSKEWRDRDRHSSSPPHVHSWARGNGWSCRATYSFRAARADRLHQA